MYINFKHFFYQEALKEFSFFITTELFGILETTFSSSFLTKAKLEKDPSLNADPMAVFMVQFSVINVVKSTLSSIGLLEEDLLSMILHWEVEAGKTVTEPELLELKKLCKDKKLFLNLGFGPLIDQENSITEWLTQAKDEEVFRDMVKEMSKDFKGTPEQTYKAMVYLISQNPCAVFTLSHKIIQLFDKISRNIEMVKKFVSGELDDFGKQLLSIFENEPAVKKMFNTLKVSKNLEEDITNMFWKISDDSSSEMFWVNHCTKCGYKLDTKIGMDQNEGKNYSYLSVCLSVSLYTCFL
jgi:hypothetical protein